jgi:hypothetical protein
LEKTLKLENQTDHLQRRQIRDDNGGGEEASPQA